MGIKVKCGKAIDLKECGKEQSMPKEEELL